MTCHVSTHSLLEQVTTAPCIHSTQRSMTQLHTYVLNLTPDTDL